MPLVMPQRRCLWWNELWLRWGARVIASTNHLEIPCFVTGPPLARLPKPTKSCSDFLYEVECSMYTFRALTGQSRNGSWLTVVGGSAESTMTCEISRSRRTEFRELIVDFREEEGQALAEGLMEPREKPLVQPAARWLLRRRPFEARWQLSSLRGWALHPLWVWRCVKQMTARG